MHRPPGNLMAMKSAMKGLGFAFLILIAACSSTGSGGPNGAGGATGSGGGGDNCPAGQMACGTVCVDTSSDSQNCGGCGIPCAGSKTCQGGQCKCGSGLLECSGSCVAPDATR